MRAALGVVVALIAGVTQALMMAGPAGANETPLSEVGFHTLPAGSSAVPQYSVAGPISGDVLVGGVNTAKVLAVNGRTGKLDTSIGSRGALRLPSRFPSGATLAGLTFAGRRVYADFNYFANGTSSIAVVCWTRSGRLSRGFGMRGLLKITGDADHRWFGGPLALAGGFLVLGGEESGLGGSGIIPGAVTLVPINPTTGAVSSPFASEPLPSGVASIVQNQLKVGPDHNLYDIGTAIPSATRQPNRVWLGIFRSSTRKPVAQGTATDGQSAGAEYLSFAGSRAYLSAVSTNNKVNRTDIFTAPLGKASGFTKIHVPLQLKGADQAPAGLLRYRKKLLVAVSNRTSRAFRTFILALAGKSFGMRIKIGNGGSQGLNLLPFSLGGIEVGTQWSGPNFMKFQTFVAPIRW